MISIAICDDDKALTGVVEQLLRRLAVTYGTDIACEVFFDGLSLIKAVTEQRMCFDLIYLDIEMAKHGRFMHCTNAEGDGASRIDCIPVGT